MSALPRDDAPTHRSPDGRPRAAMRAIGVVVVFVLLSVWALWPLPHGAAEQMLDAERLYPRASALMAPNLLLCTWILSWDTHALLGAPARLFDANIFHPLPGALALSEHLLGYWPLFAPVQIATGNAVLAFNTTLILSFALSGAAMCWLVAHWTRSLAAGVLSGVIFALAPWRLSQLAHMQLLGLYAAPLALLFWDRALAEGRPRHFVGLGASFLLQCLCSYYLAYCTAILVGLYAAVTAPGSRPGRVLTAALAVAAALAVLAVVSLPYLRLRQHGLLPERQELQAFLGVPSWRHYLTPLELTGALRPYQGRGAIALALIGLAAIVAPTRVGIRRRAPVVALVVIAAAGSVLARGPTAGGGHLYPWLWEWIPGFASTRVPARFVILVAFAVAALAGFGWTALTRRLGAPARWGATALGCAALAWDLGASSLSIPVRPPPGGPDGVPPVHRWLAEQARGEPLLELPVRTYQGDIVGSNLEQAYAFFSRSHWLPQLTGRSGSVPPSYDLLMTYANRLPDPEALQALVNFTGLGWLVVHGGDPARWRIDALAHVASFGPDRVYRPRHLPFPDWRGELLARLERGEESTTFLGTPLAPLAARDLRAEVTSLGVGEVNDFGVVAVSAALRNAGRRTWPGVAVRSDHITMLQLEWYGASGRVAVPEPTRARTVADTPPGAVATFTTSVPVPRNRGRYRLRARLVQGGRAVRIRCIPVRTVKIA